MRWWEIRGHDREVSRSMVALIVSLAAALVLGLTSWVPRYLTNDIGITEVDPGLLTVDEDAKGVATLGGGYVVQLYDSGFRFASSSGPMADTVTKGAPISVLLGSVTAETGDEHPREHVRGSLSTVHITSLEFLPGRATYRGTASGVVEGRAHEVPVLIRVGLYGGVIEVRIDVKGGDGIVVHLDAQPATTGLLPGLPERNLRRSGWWVDAHAPAGPVLTWVLHTRIGIFPADRPRAVDLRPDGRMDLHAWDDRAALTIAAVPKERVQNSVP